MGSNDIVPPLSGPRYFWHHGAAHLRDIVHVAEGAAGAGKPALGSLWHRDASVASRNVFLRGISCYFLGMDSLAHQIRPYLAESERMVH